MFHTTCADERACHLFVPQGPCDCHLGHALAAGFRQFIKLCDPGNAFFAYSIAPGQLVLPLAGSRIFGDVPEILVCSDAMYAAMDILKPHVKLESVGTPARVVIGVVEGDIHDIGKNLVKIMLEGAGFEVFDLGRDVPLQNFVAKAEEVNADIIGMSTLMSTTMGGMKGVMDVLEKEGLRSKYKVMIGGGPIWQSYANKIGADAYGNDASEAVRIAKRFAAER